jgi:hypothetical protein
MYDLLFNVPWWIPTVLFITGITLMVRGNSLQNERIRFVGAAVLILGIGWAVMSYLVDTPKETCIKQSREVVQSVVEKNWTKFDALLDPSVKYQFVGGNWAIDSRDRLDHAVQADIDHIGVSSATVSGFEALERNGIVTTRFDVLSFQKATMDQPITSSWEFDWHQASSGKWVVSEIRGVRVGNVDVKEIRGALPVN